MMLLSLASAWLLVASASAAVVVDLQPHGDHSIRVRVAPEGGEIADPPAMALLYTPPPLSTATERGPHSLTNGNLKVEVDPENGFVTATRITDGKVLLEQTALTFSSPYNSLLNTPLEGTKHGSVRTVSTFKSTATEKIVGFGEHRTGTIGRKPYSKIFAESQLYDHSQGSDASIPWYASNEGYGFVWNLPSYGSVNVTDTAIEWSSDASLNEDIWITTTSTTDPPVGKSVFAELMHHYVDAVGHAAKMPTYSTGFIQCKDRYRNQSQVLDVARGYVSRGLPISVIVIDWMHWVHQGDWQFNKECWPDVQAMVDELGTMGITLMVTFWPFQSRESIHWTEFESNGYLVPRLNGTLESWDGGDQYLYDSFNPDARKAVFQKFMEGYGKYGIKTIWIDAAEPERMDDKNVGKWRFHLGTDAEIGGAWVQQHTRMIADGMLSIGIKPEDYFILPRHAWAGTWQHSAALWSGDIVSTFDELKMQVTTAQGTMMSGPVLWTTDIGGYHGGTPSDPTFQDLIVRWFQFGAFCPLFRLHGHRGDGVPANQCGGTNGDNEVWNLAKEPQHYAGITKVMHLRENLREYVAEINDEAVATGMPMLRPMFLQWPEDKGCAGTDVEDQFMFGPRWLVAPVTTYKATSRSVYLPKLADGQEWIYYYSMKAMGSGGSRVTMDTPIDEFPLFYIRDEWKYPDHPDGAGQQ